jgi:hypothetical protein
VPLYRFDPDANERLKHPAVIDDIREVYLRYLNQPGDEAGRPVNDDEWPPLSPCGFPNTGR